MKEKEISLYVDDLRICPNDFVLAKNIEEAIYYIDNFKINILSLDHDLGLNKEGKLNKTGYDLVKYICENGYRINIKEIYLHTDNVVGKINMYETLVAAQKRTFISKKIRIYNYGYVENKYI